ncbi:alkaline phosphatase family protein [Candidatus Bathyarchaeota archaeon]|nr:alkaline phosphatase family protein [Candidatus Bathyarchaeota archaeon]
MGRGAIIGLDGVPYGLVEDLAHRGVMPNFRELLDEGVLKPMRSSIPAVSAVSWSSMMTGANPGVHGVYGYTEFLPGTYVVAYHSSRWLKAPPFWRRDPSKRYIIINLPATYPAGEVNGVLISGFVAPDLERAVYPRQLLEELRELNYKVDVDYVRASSSPLLLFKELAETLKTRVEVCRRLVERLKWDILVFVITGTDRLEHFLWDAYMDEGHEWHGEFLEYFRHVDEAIGEVVNLLGEDDALMIISDHGMEHLEVNVNLNRLLEDWGYLKLEREPKRSYNAIRRGTKAFALDPSRVYLNRVGRYPRGSVEKSDEERLLEELTELFRGLTWRGRRVIRRVYRREELYHGDAVDKAPDLVLVPEEGFNLRAGLFREEVFEREEGLSGKHTEWDALLYVRGVEGDAVPDNPSIEGVLPLFQRLMEGEPS